MWYIFKYILCFLEKRTVINTLVSRRFFLFFIFLEHIFTDLQYYNH